MRPVPTVRDRHPNERMPDLSRHRSDVRLARDMCVDATPSGTGHSDAGVLAAGCDYAIEPAFGDPRPNPDGSRATRTQ